MSSELQVAGVPCPASNVIGSPESASTRCPLSGLANALSTAPAISVANRVGRMPSAFVCSDDSLELHSSSTQKTLIYHQSGPNALWIHRGDVPRSWRQSSSNKDGVLGTHKFVIRPPKKAPLHTFFRRMTWLALRKLSTN